MRSPSKTSHAQREAGEPIESEANRASSELDTATDARGREKQSNGDKRERRSLSEESQHDDARAENAAPEGEVRWRQLLAGGTPREILCRIVQGDPLGMRDRVANRLHAESYLLDADRVQLRALARCARFAARYQGRPDLATWLDEIVDQAIEDLLREDLDADLGREVPDSASGSAPSSAPSSSPGAAFIALAAPLGLEPEAMRRACASFNQLPAVDRRAFFELVIHRRSLDELAREGQENASEIARRARRALDVLLQIQATEPRSPEGKSSAGTAARPDSSARAPLPRTGTPASEPHDAAPATEPPDGAPATEPPELEARLGDRAAGPDSPGSDSTHDRSHRDHARPSPACSDPAPRPPLSRSPLPRPPMPRPPMEDQP